MPPLQRKEWNYQEFLFDLFRLKNQQVASLGFKARLDFRLKISLCESQFQPRNILLFRARAGEAGPSTL